MDTVWIVALCVQWVEVSGGGHSVFLPLVSVLGSRVPSWLAGTYNHCLLNPFLYLRPGPWSGTVHMNARVCTET